MANALRWCMRVHMCVYVWWCTHTYILKLQLLLQRNLVQIHPARVFENLSLKRKETFHFGPFPLEQADSIKRPPCLCWCILIRNFAY